jgi:hypothetical protein
MPRDPSIAVILLCAVIAGAGCTFNARGLPTDGGGEGINWYRDGTIWPDGSLQLDFGKPSAACKTSCPLGCFDAMKRCYRIKPSNFHAITSDQWFDDMTADVAPTSGLLIFNTDTGEVTEGGVQRRPPSGKGQAQNGIYYNLLSMPFGYHSLGVFGLNSLTVTKPVRMEIEGKAAFAVYVRGNVIIDGEVVAGPEGQKPGAGGFAGGVGAGEAGVCVLGGHGRGGLSFKRSNADPGGGGGGRRRPGGPGGSSPGSVGAAGGLAVGSAAAPIFGGCGGGAGAGQEGGHGGGGGGAIQITANGTIVIEGKVNAPGAGGGAGAGIAGGGGGGSGGAILLEAFGVQVNGFIAANGGGGGGNSEGFAGQISLFPATGGKGSTNVGGGGNGGAYNIEQGGAGKVAYNGGGGGGAAGQIWIHANAILFTGPNASPRPVEQTSGVAKW